MPQITARYRDGVLKAGPTQVGTLSGDTVTITPDRTIAWPVPRYAKVKVGEERTATGTINKYRMVMTGVDSINTLMRAPGDTTVKVRYRVAGGSTAAQDTYQVDQLQLDLTRNYNELIVRGSTRFKLGGTLFVDRAGQIYRNPSMATGAGSLSGALDPSTGTVTVTAWTGGGANSVTLEGLLTTPDGQPVDDVVFTTPMSPIKPGAMQIRYQLLDGTVLNKTPDSSGVLEDNDCTITVDYSRGIVRARFGRWRTVASLTPEELAEPWYSADSGVDLAGVPSIWRPKLVLADSIIYNAVATVMLPPDSTLLGLDAARLPPTGEALLFTTGMLCLVHHSADKAEALLTAGEVIDCGRPRLYRVVIEDANGDRLPADLYTVDRETGLVTMATPLDLTDYVAPFKVRHTIADLLRLRDTDINGDLTFIRPVSHDFPLGAYCSGMLYAGTLQARVRDKFEQTTWTGEWSDTRIGDQPLASYNDAAFPIVVTNAGAYKDRILVKFISSTDFQVIGENLGLIGIGDINNNCTPINPLTTQPYFSIDYRGWGGAWATGNCLRFNLEAASYPVDLVRAIQPSAPTGQVDSVEVLLVGNVDA
jgi:hypothetical protein